MAQGLSKNDLQKLAQAKADDALLLFHHGRFSNAYYLGGYSVEFALKACIAARMQEHTIPDKNFISEVFVHNLVRLVNLAGLTRELKEQEDLRPIFHANWGIVTKWNERKRYDVTDRSTTQFFLEAIGNPDDGVLPWIQRYW